jgi:nitroreductase
MTDLDLAVVDELLSTTRSVRRRLDLDRPLDRGVVDTCIELSLQAPTGGNAQGWRWLVVTDEKLRAGLADIYARSAADYLTKRAAELKDSDPQNARVYGSAAYLVDVLHRVPVHVIPCIRGRRTDDAFANASLYGSILPSVWSFMLAARARNLGTVLTTLHLKNEAEAAALLGIPEGYLQIGLIPVAHTDPAVFKPVPGRFLEAVRFVDRWPEDN